MIYRDLKSQWIQLCNAYLPYMPEGSLWRYSRESEPDDPEQGWKIHISATILSAVETLRIVGPTLLERNLLFKAPLTLNDLDRLNAGIFYGYSQVGKFITVYPKTTDEAVFLAEELDRLTSHIPAPVVPFDEPFRVGSSVYYRYGGFKGLQIHINESISEYAIRDPQGTLVSDIREMSKPAWVSDPFKRKEENENTNPVATLLKTTYKAFRAISQRGKGGVYRALDFSIQPARLCVLKEGRRCGEVEWDGRDGYWRIEHEASVLSILRASGVNVPRVYNRFEAHPHYYLVTEYIEGDNVEKWLTRKKRRLSIKAALRVCIQYARLMSQIHAAGWVWRDCKPRNLIRTRSGRVRPIDFEGACRVDQPDASPYGTSSFLAPEWSAVFQGQSRLPEDLYALGVVLYLVLAGRTPDAVGSLPLSQMRSRIPKEVLNIVGSLLSKHPNKRPMAQKVAKRLENVLDLLRN